MVLISSVKTPHLDSKDLRSNTISSPSWERHIGLVDPHRVLRERDRSRGHRPGQSYFTVVRNPKTSSKGPTRTVRRPQLFTTSSTGRAGSSVETGGTKRDGSVRDRCRSAEGRPVEKDSKKSVEVGVTREGNTDGYRGWSTGWDPTQDRTK